MRVTLLMPTLNEVDGLRAVIPLIRKEWVDQILVVDGGSTDGTLALARQAGYHVVLQKRPSLVKAYADALPEAVGDIIVTFTPDGNSVPELIPAVIEKMKEGYDMVIVSRYREGAKSYDDDAITAFGNWMFTKMINVLFGGRYTDSLVGFRAWKKDLFDRLGAEKETMSFESFSSVKCAKRRLRVGEIPGDEPARIGGTRKMRPLVNGYHVLQFIFKELFIREPREGAS